MKSRITLVVVLGLVAISIVSTASAQPQCVQNADGTITCPILAPPLPPAAAAEAAAQESTEVAAERLTLRERRRMGFTRLNAIRATIKLAREGSLPSTRGLSGEDLEAARAEIKEAVAAEILGDNIQAWGQTVQDGRDWSEFFQALLDFLERLMPLLLQLFGGLAHNAILTPATTVADCVPVVSPAVMLAA